MTATHKANRATMSGAEPNPGRPVPVDLQSLVNTHQQPFVVIDAGYRILAVNAAYENKFCVHADQVIGKHCYEVSHNNDNPCHKAGEDCPHVSLYEHRRPTICIHQHYDPAMRAHQVRVSAYPLSGTDGSLLMGELIEEIAAPDTRRHMPRRMVGRSQPFLACVDQLKVTASTEAPVLIQGETGTGKELAAKYIHLHSPRREQPFLTVDCAVLTETLFEAEVFGHARGACTGSVGERVGLYEQANGGTLFLDEVGELPLAQQARLLRVLETGQFRRVGGRGMRSADVRIICATNRHLWDGVKAGRFREDLYYRIACLAVRMPPLRERMDDIDVLVPSLLEGIGHTMKQHYTLTPEAMRRLLKYMYPGNVRELRNILFVAATTSPVPEISAEVIDAVLNQHMAERQPLDDDWSGASAAASAAAEAVTLQEVEGRHIMELLRRYDNSRRQVAAVLGISERTLYRKLKRLRAG
jgi:transcriptional regulator with PAS, ATPase and Fis domain